jgi:hypothetical protein
MHHQSLGSNILETRANAWVTSPVELTEKHNAWLAERNACDQYVLSSAAVNCIQQSYDEWNGELEGPHKAH